LCQGGFMPAWKEKQSFKTDCFSVLCYTVSSHFILR
jgi:hypothetical protein